MKYLYLPALLTVLAVNAAFSQNKPSLALPSSFSTGVSLTPTMQWYNGGSTGSFKVQISVNGYYTTSDLVTQGFNLSAATTTWTVVSPALQPLKVYHWRVVAFANLDNGGASVLSDDWSFTTKGVPPGTPSTISPGNGSTNQAITSVLTWTAMPAATSYRYQWGTATTFGTAFTEISTTSANLSGLAYSTLYYWHVQACNSQGCSPYSATASFTTGAQVIPSKPTLGSPANGALISGNSVTLNFSATNARDYQIQIATASDFNSASIVQDQTRALSVSFFAAGLQLGVLYYWRVQAFNGIAGPMSDVRSFICANPSGTLIWPRGSASDFSSPFGPRGFEGMGVSSWFHTGVDIGPSGGGFKAPYNMTCVFVKPVANTNFFRVTFKAVDANKEPRHLAFEELDLSEVGNIPIGASFTQGQTINVHGGDASDAYLHTEAYQGSDMIVRNEDDGDLLNNVEDSWYANRKRARNPLEWFPAASGGSVTIADIEPLNNPLPTENGYGYFDVLIRSKRPNFTLDAIEVSLTSTDGLHGTDMLKDPAAARIAFNAGTYLDRGDASGNYDAVTKENLNTILNAPAWFKEKPGVRISAKTYGSTVSDKELAFRYYVLPAYMNSIREIHVNALDFRNNVLNSNIRTLGAGCINCPGNGPMPPEYLSAKGTANGVELRWNKSPDPVKSTYEYAIYRRLDGSTTVPKVIAVVPSTNLFYSDLMNDPINQMLPGKKYRYSIASVGANSEGCNGPRKANCAGLNCPLSCVVEQVATVPSTPIDLVYQGQVVTTAVGTLSAKNSITLMQDDFRMPGSITFTAGNELNINDGVTIDLDGTTTFNVTR